MKVFLSWSGEKSRAVAEALRDWLPSVIQEIEPFMSVEDIAAGARWQNRIAEELEGSSFGILCVTRENQSAPWLNFEAGAISKQVELSRVVPLAIDLTPTDVKPPLGHFQVKEMSKSGILGVLESMNDLCDKPVPNLSKTCGVWWPELEPKLTAAASAPEAVPVRDQEDLLNEILTLVRGIAVEGDLARLSPARLARGQPWESFPFEVFARRLLRGLPPRTQVVEEPTADSPRIRVVTREELSPADIDRLQWMGRGAGVTIQIERVLGTDDEPSD